MMIALRFRFLAAGMAAMLFCAAAPVTPLQEWKDGIVGQNKDYAVIPHAMLKIQDSAYLGEGQSAVLAGVKGNPATWHWDHKAGVKGPLHITVKGGRLIAVKDSKPVDPALVTKSIPIDADIDVAGQPTQVGAGVGGWRVFVFNQVNPEALHFTGVSYFPFDPAFRVTARFRVDPKLPPHVFRTSRGTDKQFYHVGDAAFTLKGKPVQLPFYSDSNDPRKIDDISAFFHDDLTGKGAYGAGRYVEAEKFGKFPPASVVIDFNGAYNPNCARSVHFTCPLAVDTIPLAVTASERDPHVH